MTNFAPPPTVSAIIPVYNGEHYVGEAIASVLAQTHPPIECLVIDDGSTDGTREAVGRFGDAVTYVRQARAGVSAARNRGLELAEGEVVAFLDHDDTWRLDKLARQIELLAPESPTMVLCAVEMVDASGAPLGTRRLRASSDLVTGLIMFDGTETVSCSSTGLIRRQDLLAMGSFDPALGMSADWDLLLRVLLEGRLEYVDEALVRYRVHDSNMSRRVGPMERDMKRAFAKAFSHPQLPAALRSRRELAYSRLYRMLSGSYRDAGERRNALRTLAIALRHRPALAIELARHPPTKATPGVSGGAAWVKVAKTLRDHPALNVPITTAVRTALQLLGRPSPWLTRHLPRSGVVGVRLPNGALLRLWSRGDDWISTQVFWHGLDGYEPETVRVFFRLAERATVTVDLGAYVGYFTVLAALANDAATVIALEPFPATFDRLQRNVSLNGLSNVVCRNLAAGASAGSADLHHMRDGMSMAASLDPAHLAAWEHVTTPVPVVRLDQLLADLGIGHVDLIKVDVEATETEVLQGAREILHRDHPDVVCEVLSADSGTRLTEMLKPLGYRFFELHAHGPRQHETIVPGEGRNYLLTTSSLADLPSLNRDSAATSSYTSR